MTGFVFFFRNAESLVDYVNALYFTVTAERRGRSAILYFRAALGKAYVDRLTISGISLLARLA